MNTLYRQLALAVALGVSAMTAQAEVVEIDAAELARLTAKRIPLIDIRTESIFCGLTKRKSWLWPESAS